MDDPRKLSQEKIPKSAVNKENEGAREVRENLESSNDSEKVMVENDLEQKSSMQEKPVEVEKVGESQIPEKEQPKEILGKQVEVGRGLAQKSPGEEETISKNGRADVEIKNLVKLAVRGAKEEREATTKARELFKKDSHSLDDFHDQLIEEKQKS